MNIPSATYRIQFHAGFTFDSAAGILPYLKELGISHIYASPILKAKKGSQHGYDVVDPARINPELGGMEKFDSLIEKLKACNLAWIQDIVPNHMAYDPQNLYLMDVLEKGIRSKYRNYFDIEWEHSYEDLYGRVLAPFLGEFYGTCLDRAEIQLCFSKQGFFFSYADFIFPLRIEDYAWILKFDLQSLEQKMGREDKVFSAFCGIINDFDRTAELKDPNEYYTRITSLKESLDRLYHTSPQVSDYINSVLKRINGVKEQPNTLDQMDALLCQQNFRFSFWKVGNEELNYRRFFTINSLVCLRTEENDVFDFIHSLIFRLVNEQKIAGLRIDHLDGLYNPLEYLRRLKEHVPDTYVIAEKILDLFEALPQDMGLQGTTGYDFLNFNNGIFVEKDNEKKFNKLYVGFTEMKTSCSDLITQKKRLFMGTHMAGDIDNLARLLKKILGASRYGRDITIYGLRRGIVEMLAHFPVYRTYVFQGNLSRQDECYIREAAACAKNSQPRLIYELDLIVRTLLLYYGAETPEQEKQDWMRFTKRFQQISGALMAKGAEDTMFYIYNRLLSLNEVGGNPSVFGISLKDFHDFNIRRLGQSRHSLNATATHDTKRGEDARARLNVLSEMPKEWASALREFAKANKKFKKSFNGIFAPDKNDEYLIYQALLGAYPFLEKDVANLRERIKAYIVKAIREAKVHTAWIKPDTAYEDACLNFTDGILDSKRFLNAFLPFQKNIAFYGIFNSLSQTLLKFASPGVPDIYQGSELWDFNLVDPDNRRPVDFEKRENFLNWIKTKEEDLPGLIKELFAHKEDGRIKLFTIHRLLKARNMFRELFQNGEYIPLETEGKHQNNIIAFARQHQNACCIAIAPRFLSKIVKEDAFPLGEQVWQDTAVSLPEGLPFSWVNIITGQNLETEKTINIGRVLDIFPVSLLIWEKQRNLL